MKPAMMTRMTTTTFRRQRKQIRIILHSRMRTEGSILRGLDSIVAAKLPFSNSNGAIINATKPLPNPFATSQIMQTRLAPT